jgi:type II secretory pathway pseudopilin PulG
MILLSLNKRLGLISQVECSLNMQKTQKVGTLSSEHGFTLVELIVTLGFGALLAISAAVLIQRLTQQTKTARIRADYTSIQNDIRNTLLNKENCIATFGGVTANDDPSAGPIYTPISGLKILKDDGLVYPHAKYVVSDLVNPLEIGQGVIINGMYLINKGNHGSGGDYELRVTVLFSVKDETSSQVRNTYTGVSEKTFAIPVLLDNCTRYLVAVPKGPPSPPPYKNAADECLARGGNPYPQSIEQTDPATGQNYELLTCPICNSTRENVHRCL